MTTQQSRSSAWLQNTSNLPQNTKLQVMSTNVWIDQVSIIPAISISSRKIWIREILARKSCEFQEKHSYFPVKCSRNWAWKSFQHIRSSDLLSRMLMTYTMNESLCAGRRKFQIIERIMLYYQALILCSLKYMHRRRKIGELWGLIITFKREKLVEVSTKRERERES